MRRFGFLNIKKRSIKSNEMIDKLLIKCTSGKQIIKYLSGGNQQKILMAKWLANQPKILIMDQPTTQAAIAFNS